MTDYDEFCRCGHAYREHNIVTHLKPCFTCEDMDVWIPQETGVRCPAFVQKEEAFFEALSHMPTLEEVYADPAFAEQEEASPSPKA